MSIDWITVAAQVLNFLVLLWLLKRFLYRPILDGIDSREREIADRLEQAALARTAAEQAGEQLRKSAERLHCERDGVFALARADAERERLSMLAETRKQLAEDFEQFKAARHDEARQYAAELQRSGVEALLALLRKALTDLADETFEQRLAAHTASRLLASSDELRRASSVQRVGTVTTRTPMPVESREHLDATLANAVPELTLQYVIDPARSPGILLQVGGARLEWSVDRYVEALHEQLEQLVHLPATHWAELPGNVH